MAEAEETESPRGRFITNLYWLSDCDDESAPPVQFRVRVTDCGVLIDALDHEGNFQAVTVLQYTNGQIKLSAWKEAGGGYRDRTSVTLIEDVSVLAKRATESAPDQE